MHFNLFDYLDWKIPKKLSMITEKQFTDEHQQFFSFYGFLNKYDTDKTPFGLIKKSIIVQSLINKKQIEEEAELYSDTELNTEERLNIIHDRLPFFRFEDTKIYVPFFSPAFNRRYDFQVESLTRYPFLSLKNDFESEVIDPFEIYNHQLFNSTFSRLVFIMKDKTCAAFYHVQLQTIFVINDQGSLDHMIPLFDADVKFPNNLNLFPRLKNLMEAYFDYDRQEFIEILHTGEFISDHLYGEITKLSGKFKTKKEKRALKASEKVNEF